MKQEAAGRIVLGLALIVSGSAYLLIRVGYIWVHDYLRIYWPVIFVALGVEIVWRQWRADRSDDQVRVSIDMLSLFGIGAISALVWGVGSMISNMMPW